jgi:bifunctional DNA-binding transcriptional regulator/antitoxin component of YhaV-PrlF toxin-antitoxin module
MSKRQYSRNKVIKPRNVKGVLFVAALVLMAAVCTGLALAYGKLREIWIQQCEVHDPTLQVEVTTTGKMVPPDAIREAFGIRKGANLWEINFEERRRDVLAKYPTIRSIAIAKRLPDQVCITITEREPVVRIGIHDVKQWSGKVADTEGVVFACRRGVDMLPMVRESATPGTAIGKRLEGHSLAALRLLESAQDAEFQELGIREADACKPDFLLVTLGNYQKAKIAWEGMDNPSPRTQDKMLKVMRNLRDAINARLTGISVIWNATEPDRVYADTKETIQ